MADEVASNEVGLIVEGQAVIMRMPEPTEYVVFSAEQARILAEGLARAAHEAYTGRRAQHNGQSYVSKALHDKLINRVSIMLTSMHSEGRDPLHQAQQVVDIVLRDVT